MKLLFVPAKQKVILLTQPQLKELRKLPRRIGLVTTAQFIDSINTIAAQLKQKKVLIGKAKNLASGQLTGCNVEAGTSIQDRVDCFLYVGSGNFHPLALALALKQPKPIFIFDPSTNSLSRLNEKVIKQAKTRQKVAKLKFLSAERLGILISIKPGQQRLKQALALKNKLKKEGKKVYLFLFDNFETNQLLNWPSIENWINTACPGLSFENPLVWIDDLRLLIPHSKRGNS